jgi:uncharacterized membrane protein
MSVSAAPATLPLRVPWATVVGAAGVAGFFSLWTWALPASAESALTIRLVQLALAASAAYLLDDAAAALTTVAPRSLWQHRVFSLAIGLPVIAVAWSVVLMDLRHLPQAALRSLTLEVVVLAVVALAASAMLASHGEPEPGNLVAVVVPLAGVGAMVLGGMLGLQVFIGGPGDGYTERTTAWVIGGVLALALLVWASRDEPS